MELRATAAIERKNRAGKLVRQYSAVLAFLILLIFNLIFTNNFVAVNTLWNLIIQSFPIFITGIGMALVISTGGIDISVGSVSAISGVLLTKVLTTTSNVYVAILCGLLVAAIIGAFNGFFITKFKLQPIIVTLVMYISGRGIAQLINGGKTLTFYNIPFLSNVGVFRVGSIPIQLFIDIAFFALFYFIIRKTVFGLRVQSIGENRKAALLSGININTVTILVYIICSLLAGMTAIFEVSRASSADPTGLGDMLEMDTIAAVVIGGTSMSGGKINLVGMMFGAFTMQLITMTVNMQDIRFSYAMIFKALVILIALMVQQTSGKK